MDKLRIIATRYNIINISSTIILLIIFVLQFRWAVIWGLFLNDDSAAVLLFWPLLLLVGVIKANKAYVRKLIHRQLKYHYEANNINRDEKKDAGSLTGDERDYLPKYNHLSRTRLSCDFDMQFYGELDDIGIDYKVDKFSFRWTQKVGRGKHEHTNTLFNYSGEALVVNYKDKEVFKEPIVFLNSSLRNMIGQGKLHLSDIEEVKVGDSILGYLNYNKEISDAEEVREVIQLINGTDKFFRKSAKIFVVFKGNHIVLLTDEKHKFKLNIPFLIRKASIEEMISHQKGNIYKFNMLLNKISQI